MRSGGLRIAATIFLLMSFPLTGCYSQQEDSPQQAQEEDPNTWDFGVVKQKEILKHDFILTNETADTLYILDTHTSCGCTVSEVKKKQLFPGEETRIEVKFDTDKYMGKVQQFVYVNTNNIDFPIIRYIIKAEIVKDGGN